MILEKEFEQYKALHKYCILKARIMQYYKDLEEGQINLPDFMRETPEQKADKDLTKLIMFSPNKFNELYEQAWNDIAERMP